MIEEMLSYRHSSLPSNDVTFNMNRFFRRTDYVFNGKEVTSDNTITLGVCISYGGDITYKVFTCKYTDSNNDEKAIKQIYDAFKSWLNEPSNLETFHAEID